MKGFKHVEGLKSWVIQALILWVITVYNCYKPLKMKKTRGF